MAHGGAVGWLSVPASRLPWGRWLQREQVVPAAALGASGWGFPACKGAELAPFYSKHQSIIHLLAKSWHFCPEEHLRMPVSPPPVQAVCQE